MFLIDFYSSLTEVFTEFHSSIMRVLQGYFLNTIPMGFKIYHWKKILSEGYWDRGRNPRRTSNSHPSLENCRNSILHDSVSKLCKLIYCVVLEN